jgi:hypothetical protein
MTPSQLLFKEWADRVYGVGPEDAPPQHERYATYYQAFMAGAQALLKGALERPMQPVEFDQHGVIRFKVNKQVDELLNFSRLHGLGLNELAIKRHPDSDRSQLAQLIGYSVHGWSTLSYVTEEEIARADLFVELLKESQSHEQKSQPDA